MSPNPHTAGVADTTYARTLSGYTHSAFTADAHSYTIAGVVIRAQVVPGQRLRARLRRAGKGGV
ncbi:hypothetical protein [Corynebacterium ulcerans]|uniref:hypothetical protein n=1 Tax=Corynebacterium ulcerans TaxID=65058 RepID=UPI000B1796F9|nr:hypothetical protein [Corynebacterium ulcerans]